MNPIIDNIKRRRSVREYESKPIPKDILEEIIDAGNYAPTGAGAQGWRFVVVESESFRKKMVEAGLPAYKQWLSKMPEAFQQIRAQRDMSPDPIYYFAPAIVFVIGPGEGVGGDYDCPMVCENIMLAARSFGIGSCWVFIGQFALKDEEVKKALEIKHGEKVYGPILLGYPKGDFPQANPKKPPVIKWIE
ncbi:MAG: nitroreductase [Elusimicrobia bacterium]|nr:nitroreductase [Elusimicrobiota bacterium]